MTGPQNRFRLKNIDNTGFGTNSSVEGGRLVNPDGSNNVRKRGLPIWERISFYHTLLQMKRSHFFLTIMLFYTATNVFFAGIYFLVGVHNLAGIQHSDSLFDELAAAFFFSSQTLTTVGYGHLAPTGLITNAIASTESLIGILAFAVVTGLIYGRFSRPRAFLLFSSNALIAPYKNGRALMLRMATYKNNHLTDVESQLTIALHLDENGKTVTRFYPLPLEMPRINSMASSWTIVHNITEESPLANYDQKALAEANAEVMIYVRAFDDHFSNTVQQRTSYLSGQVIFGARFTPMFQRSDDGSYTLLDLSKINAHEPADLP
jgi:inward rectifier potassium channel